MLEYVENREQFDHKRSDIHSGDIIAFSGLGIIGKLIRMFTGETYSHVGIAWVVGSRIFIVEALDGRGVVMRPLSEVTPFYHLQNKIEFTDAVESYMLTKIGMKYGYFDVILAGLGLKSKPNDAYQCAEFVADVFGILDEFKSYTPGKLVNFFLKIE
jgi:hypothetical protein